MQSLTRWARFTSVDFQQNLFYVTQIGNEFTILLTSSYITWKFYLFGIFGMFHI